MAQTVQIMDVAVTVTAIVYQTVQIMEVSVTTTSSPEIAPQSFTATPHYAYDLLRITATASNNAVVPTSWTWRVISPANASITGTGDTRTVQLPASVSGVDAKIGVTGTKGAVTSRERVFTIPTVEWSEWYVGDDDEWHGVAPLAQL